MLAEIESSALNKRMTVKVIGIKEINPAYNSAPLNDRIRIITSGDRDSFISLYGIQHIKIYAKNLGGKPVIYEHNAFNGKKDIEAFYKLISQSLIIEENL